jgi:hypothetical protein
VNWGIWSERLDKNASRLDNEFEALFWKAGGVNLAIATKQHMNVFISYALKDEKLAQDLAARLSADGHMVSPFDLELGPGDNWALEIGKALERSRAMIVMISPEAMRAPHVRQEIQFALGSPNYEHRLFPVLVRPAKKIPWILHKFPMISLDSNDLKEASKQIAKRLRDEDRYDGRIVPLLYRSCDYLRGLSWALSSAQRIDFTRPFSEGCRDLLRIWGVWTS